MTQPVQEPSEQRQIAAADYRTRQLARRPPVVTPDSASDGHLAMAYIAFAGETIPNEGWKGVSHDNPDPIEIFDGYTNPAAEEILVGQPNDFQHLRVDTLTDGAGTKYGIYITSGGVASEPERHGVYAITGSVEWDGTDFNGHVGLMINTGSMLPWNYSPVTFTDANLFALPDSTFTARFQSHTIVSIITGGSIGTFCGLDVYQNSGGDYDILEAGLIIQQIGWWSNSEGSFFPFGT